MNNSLSLGRTHNDESAMTTTMTIVTELHPHDVLLGRTAAIVNYTGNQRYRQLVRLRKADYMSTGRHRQKDEIARQVMAAIHLDGGRFLRLIESSPSTDDPSTTEMTWRIVSEDTALQKVKQALREELSSKEYAALQSPPAADDEIVATVDAPNHEPNLVGSSVSGGQNVWDAMTRGYAQMPLPLEASPRLGTIEALATTAVAQPQVLSAETSVQPPLPDYTWSSTMQQEDLVTETV
jgi:hypothetical protein